MERTRINVEIDDDDVAAVMSRYRIRTKTEAEAHALRRATGDPITREEALGMRGAQCIEAAPEDRAPRG